MNVTDQQIRDWATRHNLPIPPGQPISDPIRQRYQAARAYRIRQTYAKRAGKRASQQRQSRPLLSIRPAQPRG